jgi:hypothetical protein
VHDVPSLDQLAVNSVDVVPLPGLIAAEHVGGFVPVTVTRFDAHALVPPGPVAVNVTEWLPAVNDIMADPEHSMLPWGTPSSAQVQDAPVLAQLTVNDVDVVPLLGLIDAEQVGTPSPSTSTPLEVHDVVPPGPTAVSVTA